MLSTAPPPTAGADLAGPGRLRTLAALLASTALGAVAPLLDPLPRFAVLRARALIGAGRVEQALLFLHGHLAARPGDPWLHYHAGRAAQAKGLPREARARFAHAAALAPEEATFRFALGHLHKTEGQLTPAAWLLVPDRCRQRRGYHNKCLCTG